MAELKANGRSVLGLGRREFIAVFGAVYEHSPWVAERVLDNGLDTSITGVGELAAVMRGVVDRAGEEKQLALLRAHPHLVDGLKSPDLTTQSTEEQQSAGLDSCTPEEIKKFQKLNTAYTNKFGFPFIVAVAGKGRHEILRLFESRLADTWEEEFATGLSEVHKIAWIRLQKLAGRDE